ncbi:MAG: hypothetical protein ACTSVB_09790 [Candidatus Heimdallarchaeaceae archaeon]
MKECTLYCRSFRCTNRALKVERLGNGSKKFICTMEGDECIGYFCKYASCAEKMLADDGRCLRPDKKVTSKPKKPIKIDKYDVFDTNSLDDRLYKKLRRKM